MLKAKRNIAFKIFQNLLLLLIFTPTNLLPQKIIVKTIYDNPIVDKIVGYNCVAPNNVFIFTKSSIHHYDGKRFNLIFQSENSIINAIDTDGENIVFNLESLINEYRMPLIYHAKYYNGVISNIRQLHIPFTHEVQSIKFISKGKCLLGGVFEYAFVQINSNSITFKIFNFPFADIYFSFNVFPYPSEVDFIPFHIDGKKDIFYFVLENNINLEEYFNRILIGLDRPEWKVFSFNINKVIQSIDFLRLTKKGKKYDLINLIVRLQDGEYLLLKLDSSNIKVKYLEEVSINNPFQLKATNIPFTTKYFSINFQKIIILNPYSCTVLGLTKTGEILQSIDDELNEWELLIPDFFCSDIIPISKDDFFAFTNTKVYHLSNNKQKNILVGRLLSSQNSIIHFEHNFVGFGEFFGISTDDFDNDGIEDIYFLNVKSNGTFYKGNELEKYDHFNNIASKIGLAGKTYGSIGVVSGDVNNDKYIDVIITDINGNTDIYINKKGYFRNCSNEFGLTKINTIRSEHIALSDVNADSWIDIFITSFSGSNKLLLNLHGRKFIDFTEKAGLVSDGRTVCASFCDINGDGYPDLYIGNWTGGNKMYLNNRDGTFRDITEESSTGGDVLMKTNSILFADFNNDGYPDLFVGNRGNGNLFFINDGTGKFKNISKVSGLLDSSLFTYGSTANDFDNDGLLDLFICYLGGVKLYKNFGFKEKGIPHFKDVTNEYIGNFEQIKGYNTSCVSFDMNNDGDIDIFFTRYHLGSFNILKNYLNNRINAKKNYVKVKLIGVSSNSNCIGATIKLLRDGETLATRYITAGSGYASSESKIIHFVLPDENGDYEIKVDFPVYKGNRIIKKIKVKHGEFIEVVEIEGFKASLIALSRNFEKLLYFNNKEIVKFLFILTFSIFYILMFYFNKKVFMLPLKIISISISFYLLTIICIIYLFEEQPQIWIMSSNNWFIEDFIPLTFFGMSIYMSYLILSKKEVVKNTQEEVINSLIEKLGEFEHSSIKNSILIRLSLIIQNFSLVKNETVSNELRRRLSILISQYSNIVLPDLYSLEKLCEILGIKFNSNFATTIDSKSRKFLNGLKLNKTTNKKLAYQIVHDIYSIFRELDELKKKVYSSYICIVEEVIRNVINSFAVNYIFLNSNGTTKVIFNEKDLFNMISIFIENSIQAFSKFDTEPRIDIKLVENENIEIHIIDNGPGIPKEQFESILKLKNTTKPSGHGFGLVFADKCARKFGGKLEFIPEDKGCHFVIKLKKALIVEGWK